MTRAELDYPDPPIPSMGAAEVIFDEGEEHAPHTFLYLPDLATDTGWSTHRVPERQNGRSDERRAVGFRR